MGFFFLHFLCYVICKRAAANVYNYYNTTKPMLQFGWPRLGFFPSQDYKPHGALHRPGRMHIWKLLVAFTQSMSFTKGNEWKDEQKWMKYENWYTLLQFGAQKTEQETLPVIHYSAGKGFVNCLATNNLYSLFSICFFFFSKREKEESHFYKINARHAPCNPY